MFAKHMQRTQSATLMVLGMMLFSGCISIVDDIQDEFDRTYDFIQGDYPQLALPERTRGQSTLSEYDDCDALLLDLQNALYNEMLVRLDQESYYHWVGGWWMWGGPEMAVDDAVSMDSNGAESGASSPASGASRDGEFSETNNQEAGVDEADFLKTDGYHIYMLNGNSLVIMGVPEFGEVELTSEMTIEGMPMQMMMDGDRLVIASMIYAWNLPEDHPMRELLIEEVTWGEDDYVYTYYRVQNLVKYTVVDITDRSDPSVEREIYIEGNYHTARMVDGTVRSVTHNYANFDGLRFWVSLPSDYWEIKDENYRKAAWQVHLGETIRANTEIIEALTLDDFAPHIYEMTQAGLVTHPTTSEDCSEFAASTDSVARGFTSIMTFELLGEDVEIELDHIASSWANVYASQNVLLLAEPANDWWWFWRNSGWEDATNIHAFDISSSTTTTYMGSGRVSGTVQDQFSMSEYNGAIRIASTSDMWGRWWMAEEVDPDTGEPVFTGPTNDVTILEFDGVDTLDEIGHIGGIAPGERIWSVRFMGERGYLVTFRNMDPLWVLDLSDPTNPTILGELEIPGVSTYIHPVNENTLLTIGIGPGPDGLGLDWSVTQISLFDVSDPANPRLADTLALTPGYADGDCEEVRECGWSWSWSEATYEHKAFTYWAPENLLAVPLSTHRYSYDQETGRGGYEYVSTLQLINVDAANLSLSMHGDVNHSAFYNDEGHSNNWWYGFSTSIRRSIFMGDYVYAFSALGVTVTRTEDLAGMVELEIPGHEQPDWYYDGEEADDGEKVDPEDSGETEEESSTGDDEASDA